MFRHPLAKLLLLGQLALMSWMAQANPPVEIEDVMGRKVSLSLPASRIVLGFYPEDYLAVAGEGGADRLVGMSRGWFVKSRPAIWSLYVASLPQLAKVPDLGNVQDQSFSIEKTLAVKPDLLILAKWQYAARICHASNRLGSRWWSSTTTPRPWSATWRAPCCWAR